MPTTSNFGWTTPADTDLVKDGAAAIRTLGNGIDTSLVDLKGGTTGQNLRKNSNTDLDFTWAGDATNTVVDAAGDLLYGTAADTLGRLAIGTAGQVLKVNSGATAPEWGSASGVNPLMVFTNSNNYVSALTTTTSISTSGNGVTEDITYFIPVFLPAATVDRLSIRTGSSWGATSITYRLGIYNAGTNNKPDTVLLDAGTVVATAASTTYEITVSQTISTAGYYWLAVNYQSGVSVTGTNILFHNGIYLNTAASEDVTNAFTQVSTIRHFRESGVTGAFATVNTANLTSQTGSAPIIAARIN